MRMGIGLLAPALFSAASAFAVQTEIADAVQMSARGSHACVTTSAGAAKCWGSNSNGQLGAGPLRSRYAWVVDGLGSGVVHVAAGISAHSCAIVTGGAVKCWGANASGQLGDGTTTERHAPVDVALPWPAASLSAGLAHTCAVSTTGAAACWGQNWAGQLGDGTQTQRLTPTLVSGLGSGVTAISAGTSHTCAILSGGAAKCWGSNFNGELGDGTTDYLQLAPVDVIGLGSGVTAIDASGTAGAMFIQPTGITCAIASGVAKCWGRTPTDVSGIAAGATGISYGGGMFVVLRTPQYHTHACVVTAEGGAQCWGSNWCGIIGDGLPPDCGQLSFPTSPPTTVVGLSSGVASVFAAHLFTCALLVDGRVKCWGNGNSTPVTALEGTTPRSIFFYSGQPRSVTVNGTVGISVGPGGGNPITFTSLTPGTCSVTAGGTVAGPFGRVTGLAAGTCTIAAVEAGDAWFDPSPQIEYTLPVDGHLAQTITIIGPSAMTIGSAATITATASSGLPVTISGGGMGSSCDLNGNVVAARTTGPSCIINASQPGNNVYAAAEATLFIEMNPSNGTYGLAVYSLGGGRGTVTSTPAGIDCGSACTANFIAGSAVTLTAAAAPGAAFTGWTGACAGTGPCTVALNAVAAVGARFSSTMPRLGNLSTRAKVLTGNDVLIGGFIIGGSSPKRVVVRARGPSLAQAGVPVDRTLGNPKIDLYSGANIVATNDQWMLGDRLQLEATGFAPPVSNEAAIVAELPPGPYTAIVSGLCCSAPGTLTGIGLVEIFEVDHDDAPLIDIAARAYVGTDDEVMIAGFVIQGDAPQAVVVRARGPSLSAFGVPDVLADPQLQLVRSSDGATLGVNDDWQAASNANAIQASGFAPANASESAILVTLPPGAYTAIVSGVKRTTGAAIVEVFRN